MGRRAVGYNQYSENKGEEKEEECGRSVEIQKKEEQKKSENERRRGGWK